MDKDGKPPTAAAGIAAPSNGSSSSSNVRAVILFGHGFLHHSSSSCFV